MAGARHFFAAGTYPGDVKADVTDDIKTYHQLGNGQATDEALDELNDVNNGTWQPKHA